MLLPKILIFNYSNFKFGRKNTQKYVFDVKFPTKHDPGVDFFIFSQEKPESRKKVKNRKIAVA